MNFYHCTACGAGMHTLYPVGGEMTCPNCGGKLEKASKTTDHKIPSQRSKCADDQAVKIRYTAKHEG